MQPFSLKKVYCVDKGFVIICVIFVDMEDLKNFSKSQGAAEADDLNHWDLTFGVRGFMSQNMT